MKVLNWIEHRKTIILAGACGQALMWLPLLLLPIIFPERGPWLVIVCAVGYFAMGHFTIPAWNSLIADLVDPNARGLYFARRHRRMALASFTALCAAGLILHWAEMWGMPWIGFGVVFLVAAAARGASACLLSRLDESAAPVTREAPFRPFQYLRDRGNSNFKRFVVFSGLMHVSVMIAGPYFVVYLLHDLHLGYLEYALWLAAQVLGQLFSLKRWGRIGDTFGNKKLLAVTGLTVPFIPMLYLVSTQVWFLILVSFAGGIIWAGLSLGLQNYVLDIVPPEDRAKSVAIANSINALGWFLGAMLGGWLATVVSGSLSLPGFTLQLISNLPVVFFLSGLLRLVVSLTLLKTLKEGRVVSVVPRRALVAELPLIQPLTGVLAGGIGQWSKGGPPRTARLLTQASCSNAHATNLHEKR